MLLKGWTWLIILTTIEGKDKYHHHLHLTDENTGTERLSNLLKVTPPEVKDLTLHRGRQTPKPVL